METFRNSNFHEVFDQLSSTNNNCMEDGTESHFSDYEFWKEIAELGDIQELDHDHTKKKNQSQVPSMPSLELLKSYDRGIKRLRSDRIIKPQATMDVSDYVFSAEKIMRVTGERFIQSYTKNIDVVSMLENPFDFSFPGLSDDENTRKVDLAELLLASADKVGHQLYDRATTLLNKCDQLSSSTGNPVQRVVYYFSKALRERIHRETGKFPSQELEKQQLFNIDEAIKAPTPGMVESHQKIPFCQIAQFAGIQAIIENVTGKKKIHIIDLIIRIGVHLTDLMQVLVSESGCSVQLLKISAIGTSMKQLIEDIGKRLAGFAKSINLPFSFKIVMVSDLLDLQEDRFELDPDETVVVYC